MICLYSSTSTNFNHLGIGVLKDFKENPKVIEELNGNYTLSFNYAKNGYLSDYLVEGNIVKANNQLFRIWQTTKTLEGIQVEAKHIVFDLDFNFIEDSEPTNKTPQSALQWLLDRANYTSPYTVSGTATTTGTARYVRKSLIECIYSADNSILNRMGGEISLDNFNISFSNRRGTNTNFSIRYRKNLSAVSFDLDFSTISTRIMPKGKDELLLTEKYVDSPLINNYPFPIVKMIEFSDIEDETELRNAANELFTKGIDKPSVSITIDFIELSKCEEYKDFSNLEYCNLGDTIKAIIPELGLNLETRIVKTEYDCILNRYTKLELGSIRENIATAQAKEIIETKNLVESTFEDAKANAENLINHPFNGNLYIDKNSGVLYLMDSTTPETAVNVWKWSLGGLGFSSTGINGTYGLAITQDGSIVADYITTGTINTSLIEGYGSIEVNVNTIMNNVDEAGNITSVKTTNGFTFDENGLNINTSKNEFNTQITPTSMQHKNGNDIITETSKDGFMTTDLNVKDQHFYSYDGTNYKMVAERVENEGEHCYAHFYNGN